MLSSAEAELKSCDDAVEWVQVATMYNARNLYVKATLVFIYALRVTKINKDAVKIIIINSWHFILYFRFWLA